MPRPKKRRTSPTPPSSPALDWKLYARLVDDSPLPSDAAAEGLAESFVMVTAMERVLRARMEAGDLTSDELRTLSACASNKKRLAEALGLTETEEEAPDFTGDAGDAPADPAEELELDEGPPKRRRRRRKAAEA